MIKSIGKILGVLLILDFIIFLGMITTAMTDEKPSAVGKVFYWILKYILGFPLVIINNRYPFYLEATHIPAISVALIILNNFILAFIIWSIKKTFR